MAKTSPDKFITSSVLNSIKAGAITTGTLSPDPYSVTFDQLNQQYRYDYQRDIYGRQSREPVVRGSSAVVDLSMRFNEQMQRFEEALTGPLKAELRKMEQENESLMAQLESANDEIADLQETLAECQATDVDTAAESV